MNYTKLSDATPATSTKDLPADVTPRLVARGGQVGDVGRIRFSESLHQLRRPPASGSVACRAS